MATKKAPTKKAETKGRATTASPSDLTPVYARLRKLVEPHIGGLANLKDGEGEMNVDSHDTAPNGAPLMFLGLSTRKKAVSVYLMPIYVNPELAEGISPELTKRRQGKSCFNFATIDDELFSELEKLIVASRKRWEKDGRIS